MKPFEYFQPKSLKDASRMLRDKAGETLPFAGGTDLLGLMKDGVTAPRRLVNLKRLPGMDRIEIASSGEIKIGALVKIADIAHSALIQERLPALAQAARQVASPQLRNMGTLGGNLCQRPRCWYFRGDFHCIRKGGDICYAVDGHNKYHCIIGGGPCYIVHPSDLAVALLALNAQAIIFSGKKSRAVSIGNFYLLPDADPTRETILQPGEIVTAVHIPPPPPRQRGVFLKVRERESWDFALVSLAAILQVENQRIRRGRMAFGGVAPVPWIEEKLNNMLVNFAPTEKNIRQLTDIAFRQAEPLAENDYKIILARNLIRQALEQLTRG